MSWFRELPTGAVYALVRVVLWLGGLGVVRLLWFPYPLRHSRISPCRSVPLLSYRCSGMVSFSPCALVMACWAAPASPETPSTFQISFLSANLACSTCCSLDTMSQAPSPSPEKPVVKTKPRVERNRVLVTGGAGFVGSHLCEFLVGQAVPSVYVQAFSQCALAG